MNTPFRLPDGPRRAKADVEREIAFHLEQRAREFEAQGLTPEAARQAALASFGDRERVLAACADERAETLRRRSRLGWLAELRQDLGGALRGLGRAPGFALVAILTIALGIGANSAIFAVVRSVLLAPLPYPAADRLVQLWTDERASGRATPEWLTPPDFLDWQRENRTFQSMAAYQGWGPDLTGDGEPEALQGGTVTAGFFATLGIRPALGRDFSLADDDAAAPPVVIVTDGFWRRRLGADPAALGRPLTLNGEPWTLVGVLPPNFRSPALTDAEIWRPYRRPATSGCRRDCIVLRAIGRLKPEATMAQAHQDLATIASRLATEFPETNRGRGVWLIPLHDQITGTSRAALVTLAGAVGLVLLIACVNLANLLLVRGASRGRELAVRAALGAGRGRLLRQLITESLLLAALGGALGLALAVVAGGALSSLVPPAVRAVQRIRIDGAVVAFTALVTVLSGLLFGALPAMRSVGVNLMEVLRMASRPGGRRSGRLRHGLVVAEIALSVMLLVGAGLLFRSFLAMQRVDLGFRTEGVVTASVTFPRARYQEPTRAVAAIEDLLGRLRAHPAVAAAEAVDQAPLSGGGDQDTGMTAPGEPKPELGGGVWYRTVSTGYLQVLGFRLVAGRMFEPADQSSSGIPIVINQETARRFWRDRSPVGRELVDDDGNRATVIGVVADGRPDGPREPVKPEMFVPIGRFPVRGVTLVLAPTAGREAALAAIRETLRAVDPLVPIAGTSTLEAAAREAVALPRTYAGFVLAFAAVALLLAAIGVYGVMAFSVTQRHREIGVRLALGAAPAAVRRMFLVEGARLAGWGALIGAGAAAALATGIRSLLFGVGPLDPVTFLAVPLLLGVVTLVAAWIPAARATRIDPLGAIRAE